MVGGESEAGFEAVMRYGEKYDAAPVRRLPALIATACSLLALTACGSESVEVSADDPDMEEGAEIFATHCAGCHSLGAAGTQGSGNRALRTQGPDFDQRKETYQEALFAIRNGGFGGAIMPQNIVVGEDAKKVARFLAEYSGSEVEEPARPPAETGLGGAEEPVDESGGPGGGGQGGVGQATGGGQTGGGQAGGQTGGGTPRGGGSGSTGG